MISKADQWQSRDEAALPKKGLVCSHHHHHQNIIKSDLSDDKKCESKVYARTKGKRSAINKNGSGRSLKSVPVQDVTDLSCALTTHGVGSWRCPIARYLRCWLTIGM